MKANWNFPASRSSSTQLPTVLTPIFPSHPFSSLSVVAGENGQSMPSADGMVQAGANILSKESSEPVQSFSSGCAAYLQKQKSLEKRMAGKAEAIALEKQKAEALVLEKISPDDLKKYAAPKQGMLSKELNAARERTRKLPVTTCAEYVQELKKAQQQEERQKQLKEAVLNHSQGTSLTEKLRFQRMDLGEPASLSIPKEGLLARELKLTKSTPLLSPLGNGTTLKTAQSEPLPAGRDH